MEETISLEEIFGIIKKKAALIFSMLCIGVGLASVVTFFLITPQYSSSTQLLAKMSKSENNSVNVGDVNANLMLINTYKDVIKSNAVIDEAYEVLVKESGFEGTEASLRNMISVEQSQNSQMFTIKAVGENPVEVQMVANSVSKVFQKKAKDLIDVDKVSIIAQASLNEHPISPNNKLNILIGAVLGLFVGLGFALLSQLLDKTVKDDKYITETLGFKMLGTVSEISTKELDAKAKQQAKKNKKRSRRKG